MAVQSNRYQEKKPPSKTKMVKALYDKWAFLDMIGFHGGVSNFGAFHKELVDFETDITGSNRQLYLVPRGHLKSTLLCVADTLWNIYINPNIRIFVGSANKFLSTAFIREIKVYLEDAWLQENVWARRPHFTGNLVPTMDRLARSRRYSVDTVNQYTETDDKKVVWRADSLQVNRTYKMKEPTVVSGSVGSLATGFHFDRVVFDDAVTYDNSNTPEKRDKLMSWIYDLESVLDPDFFDWELYERLKEVGVPDDHAVFHSYVGDKVKVLGTRYHKDDYYGYLLENADELHIDVFQRNIYVNGKNDADGYIWHERFNEDVIKRLRTSMSSSRFASQYLNEVISDEDKNLHLDGIHWFPETAVSPKGNGYAIVTYRVGETTETKKLRLRLVVDPAASLKSSADYTAIIVGTLDSDGHIWVVEASLGRWRPAESMKEIWRLADKWQINAVTVETSAGFASYALMLRDNFKYYRPLTVHEYRPLTGQQSTRKQERMNMALQPRFDNEMMHLARPIRNNSICMEQLTFFGRPGIHDDFPDAMTILCETHRTPVTKAVNRLQQHNTKWGGIL